METLPIISSLSELLHADSLEISYGELQLKDAITRWIRNRDSPLLTSLLNKYLETIEKHINQLQLSCDQPTIVSSNSLMQAHIEDTDRKLAACGSAQLREVSLVANIQRIAHLKIVMYGTAAAFAASTGLQSQGLGFHQAELEEKEFDERLSFLAEHELNRKANLMFAPGN